MTMPEWNAGRLLELSGGYWQTCALHAAVKLDVVGALDGGAATAAEVARALGANERGIGALLNALTAMGLFSKCGDLYACVSAAERLLSKRSEAYIGYMILHHYNLSHAWVKLHEAVRSGQPVRHGAGEADEAEWRESFLMGMFNMAMSIAPGLAQALDLSGRRHLLDLGGGPGTYAIQFCLQNPELKATIFDLPPTRPFAEKTVARFGLGERIRFLPGSYLEARKLEGRYDAAWLSHILHGEGPAACQRIVSLAASALQPGGVLMVHEFILDDTMDGPLFPALFSLNMLLGTESGQSYPEGRIMDFLAKAGLRDITRMDFRGPNDSGIVMGTAG